jgi:hypothetical protein
MSGKLSKMLALSAAALFLGACSKQSADQTQEPEPAAPKKMKCFGANDCAGQSVCDVPDNRVAPGSVGHTCGGLNECKGKGWLALTPEECEAGGGELL